MEAATTEDLPAMACSVNGAILERVECILSYGGSTRDIVINYILLVINLAGCWALLSPQDAKLRHKHRGHLASFVFVWVFQISLCLLLAELSDDGYGCAGISIVWCAMAGWMCQQHEHQQGGLRKRHQQHRSQSLWRLLVACNIVAIVYYWMTEDFITTVAHFCAWVLGVLLCWLTK